MIINAIVHSPDPCLNLFSLLPANLSNDQNISKLIYILFFYFSIDTNSNLSRKYEESRRLVETFSSSEEEMEKIRTENENLQVSIQRLKTQVNDLEIKVGCSYIV